MKKTLTNYEIDNIVSILVSQDCFRFNRQLKLSQSDRQAIRLNLSTLNTIHTAYEEGRNDINMSYVEAGKTEKVDDGTQKVKQEYIQEFQKEMIELLSVTTEVDIIPLSHEGIDKILAMDISIPEEDVVLFFKDDEEPETPEATEQTE